MIRKHIYIYFVIGIYVFFASSCASIRFSKQERKKVDKIITSSVLNGHHFGIQVYDPERKEILYAHQADKLFTPASQTKILTLFTRLYLMDQTHPVFRWTEQQDTLWLQGTANPILYHPSFEYLNQKVDSFLYLHRDKQLRILERPTKTRRFGKGWMWDDYPYYFQTEIKPFAIAGNSVWISFDSDEKAWRVYPAYFQSYIRFEPNMNLDQEVRISRDEMSNVIHFQYNPLKELDHIERRIPFMMDSYTIQRVLEDCSGQKAVYTFEGPELLPNSMELSMDSVYRKMMLESDNFLADHLLLASSTYFNDTLSQEKVISEVMKLYFPLYKEKVEWVDGSGLSRYNQFSPAFLIRVLEKIKSKLDDQDIAYYFPIGGETGTLKHWYADQTPYVFAKTGTMTNHHGVSGYLKTDTGKWLLFSMMNAGYVGSSDRVKPAMEEILQHFKAAY